MSAQLMKMIYTFLMAKAKLIKKPEMINEEPGTIKGSPSPTKRRVNN